MAKCLLVLQKELVANKKAIKAVKEGRVLQINCGGLSFYVFVSKNRAYIVSSNSCSCPAFVFRVLKGEKPWCYHIESFRLSLELDKLRRFTLSREECTNLLLDLLSQGKSLILERLWASREHS